MIESKQRQRLKQDFRNRLLKHVESFSSAVSTQGGDWVVKGFIEPSC
jgi:hypothetical protein